MIDYFLHRFDKNDFRIVMTILVKNEVDIIETNIRVHAALGVDAFVVMDNDSTDGTTEILERLSGQFEIRVIKERGLYNQAVWMKRLASEAKRIGADWVINNDADEFWIPSGEKSLRQLLAFKGSVLTVQRYNMVPEERFADEAVPFYQMRYRVENPVYYQKSYQQHHENVSIVLAKIAPKVITNPHGLLWIRGGNHKALHIGNLRDYFKHYDKIKRMEGICVYHYPIRSYAQFEKNIRNRKMLLESRRHIRMGAHYRRWVRLLNEGRLFEEYRDRLLFNKTAIDVFKKYGVMVEDDYPASRIGRLLGSD